ncbi:MAG: extracellular solute-binding protein [Tissierellia bacterium]|nr:extracellular solute-binding protein [Tissierellia bacterium]
MKKSFLISSALAILMILTSCAQKSENRNDDNPKKALEVRGVKAEISVQVEKEWRKYYEDAIERVLKDNPKSKINIIEVDSFDHLDIIDKVDSSNLGIADLFAFPTDRLYSLYERHLLADIDSKAIAEKIGGWDDFDGGIGGSFKIKNRYFAFPYNIETMIIYINKNNAENAGIDLNNIEICDMDPGQILIPIYDSWYGTALTNASDIKLMERVGDKFKSDMESPWIELSQEKRDGMTAIYDYWRDNFKENPSIFDPQMGFEYMDSELSNGKKGILLIAMPYEDIFEKSADKVEIFPLNQLKISGKPLLHWKGGWGLGINSRIQEDEAKIALAHDLISEIVSPEYAVELFKSSGKILENADPAIYEKSDLNEIDKKIISTTIKSYKNSAELPVYKEWLNVWKAWEDGILAWNLSQPDSPEEAYEEMRASFESVLEKINK